MSKYAFRWAVAILVTVMLSLLSVIGKQSPEALANLPQQKAQMIPAKRAQMPAAKPIDPAQERQEREAKFDAVRRGEISFCEAFKSDLQSVTGISKPCLSDDPTYRAVRDGMRDALRR